jgi:hypothetical protein
MPRVATLLAAAAVTCGAGLIGLAAGGMTGVGGELRAATAARAIPVVERDHHCERPERRDFDARQL